MKEPTQSYTFYERLGVTPEATDEQIKSAFRALAKLTHPDSGTGTAALFASVQEAFDVLSDPERRKVYDRSLHHSPTPSGTPSGASTSATSDIPHQGSGFDATGYRAATSPPPAQPTQPTGYRDRSWAVASEDVRPPVRVALWRWMSAPWKVYVWAVPAVLGRREAFSFRFLAVLTSVAVAGAFAAAFNIPAGVPIAGLIMTAVILYREVTHVRDVTGRTPRWWILPLSFVSGLIVSTAAVAATVALGVFALVAAVVAIIGGTIAFILGR